MGYKRKDHFYRMAKLKGKASRAVFKISELQDRFGLVKKGDTVLDLGSAPGGWLEELARMTGPSGKLIGVDILPLKISPPKGCIFISGNINDDEIRRKLIDASDGTVDAIVSDISPNLSGIAFADAYRSFELAMMTLSICDILLKKGGNFAAKFFPGRETNELLKECRARFEKISMITPKATRKTSSERYIVGIRYK